VLLLLLLSAFSTSFLSLDSSIVASSLTTTGSVVCIYCYTRGFRNIAASVVVMGVDLLLFETADTDTDTDTDTARKETE